MDAAYSTDGWGEFLVAGTGAAAALTGLVFVGISINLADILKGQGLAGRAGETIVVLANAMVVGVVCLIPGQTRGLLGAELLGLGLAALITTALIQRRSPSPHQPGIPTHQRPLLTLAATLPFVVAGASLVAGWGGGLHWMAGGLAVALAVGVLNGWVLLIEILR